MKKRFLVFFAVFSLCASLFAQVSLDPNDPFYADAKNWETAGIVNWLPQIRPYSVQAVKKILNQVKENGSEEDIKKAEFYEKKYFSKGWNAGIEIGDKANLSNASDLTKNMFYVAPRVWGDFNLGKYVGFGYKVGILVNKNDVTDAALLPMYYTSLFDTSNDPFSFGSFVANWDITGSITFGLDNLYGLLSVNKVAYGPFIDDSVMLNGGQFHTGNFGFVYEGDKFGYTHLFSILSRGTVNGKGMFMPEKFMGFQSYRFTPIKQLAISFFDAGVYTNRFDPSYLLPIPFYVMQATFSNSDNWAAGLTFDIRPIDKLGISLCGVIDDVDLNSFVKGDFNSRFKFALQGGINYTPSVKFIDNLSLDYTINAPYTLTHSTSSVYLENLSGLSPSELKAVVEANYNRDLFTTHTSNLGTKLPPNSDRIQFKAKFTPTDRLKLDFSTTFVRHANIAEGFTNEEAKQYLQANYNLATADASSPVPNYLSTDGSIWTAPLSLPSRERNNFLRQEHVMYILQLGLNAEYELERMKWGSMVFNFGYMFEYIYNKGVDSDIYKTGVNNPTDADVAAAKAQWVANLRNVFNNYFSVSVKYYY
ncbi:hypothetical protein [Treponema sp.]|uniref:hypothetical protein n=1 Tax=Treponema sp. TaxID=166 RepID=UPI00298D67DF|nr:hypothetical protein [Treponema sp.]MCR5612279.1 hypothetical protein [Treponema sp.]